MALKGLPFIGKMNDYINKVIYATIQKTGNSSAALDVTGRAFFCVNGTTTPLSVEAGSTDNILVKTGLNAKPGDVIRILSSANGIKEFEITVDEAPNTNTALLAGFLSANLAVGDTFHLLRPVRELVSSDGSTLATVISPPLQYQKKVAGVTSNVTVLDDQDTPANTKPLPVVIRGTDGATLVINAGDLNVSVDHTNDSIKIGDGARLAGVTPSNELKTSDASALTKLTSIDGKDFATSAKQDTAQASLTSIDGKLSNQATAAKQDTAQASLTSIDGKLSNQATAANQTTANTSLASIDTKLSSQATAANQTTANSSLASIDTKLSSQATAANQTTANTSLATIATASGTPADGVASSDSASGSIIAFLKRIATNITAMSAKLPSALGATASTGSLSVVPATDASFVMKTKALTLQMDEVTVSTSAIPVTAPANAIGFKIQSILENPGDIRFKIGGTATTANGMKLEAGRSEDVKGAGNLSLIASAGSNYVCIIWTIQA